VHINWDIDRYASRMGGVTANQHEAALQEEYPPMHEPPQVYSDPLTLVNVHGRILTWYLPGLLSKERQVVHQYFAL